jgi:hypothetical protein
MIRSLLLALLLACMPGAAWAQAPSALQRMGIWGQQLGAAQQPLTDAYGECSPVFRQAQLALESQSVEQMRALLTGGSLRACVERMRAAGATARDNLTRLGSMPPEMERMLHLDSRDILRRAAASIDGTVAFNERIVEALDALSAGDLALMQRKLSESRELAGSVFDGQIVLLETLRAGMPMQFHRAMMDLRLALTRGMRLLIMADPAAESGETSAGVRAEAARIRAAAQALQANWTRESLAMRRAVARLNDRRRAALIGTLDEGIGQVAVASLRVAASLEAFPAGRLDAAAGMRAMQDLADTEMLIVGLAQRFAVAASQLG